MLRVIAKLDVKPPYVIKPVHFEGLRKIDFSETLAQSYYQQGADEIVYVDVVASLYRREILFPEIEEAAKNVFVPMGIGGGVRSIEDFSKLFHIGADKVVINTHALQDNPNLINEASSVFGSQSVVVNIEAKKVGDDWECYSDCGRIRSGKSVLNWVREIQDRGAGEILLQSVDMDGRRRGFDIELISQVVNHSRVPVVAASGAGSMQDVLDMVERANPSAVCVASLLHYKICNVAELKSFLHSNGIEVNR